MIKSIDYKDGKNSIYSCDMCKKEIKGNERYSLTSKSNEDHISFHLCERCNSIVLKNIQNWEKIHRKKEVK